MKKNNNLIGIILFLLTCILFVQPQMLFSQQKENHDRSKQLIERYNKLRSKKNLPFISHDILLDNVASKIFLSRNYKNSNGSYNEDSIRLLFYKNGVIDYQYEIKEVMDKDTTATFNSFLLADKSNNMHVGYKRSRNKNILIKTKSYLKFDHGMASVQSDPIDGLHSKVTKVKVRTDEVISYFKTSHPGKYYYQFYHRIPSSRDRLDNIKKFEVQTVRTNKKNVKQNMYDLVIKSTFPNTNDFLVISNNNNERIVVIN